MSDDQVYVPGLRYIVARGRNTALRYALPHLGSLTIGEGPINDLRLREPGVASEHAIIFLDHGVGLRVLDADSARLTGQSERKLAVGETIELELGDRVRLGTVELSFAPAVASRDTPRVLTRAYFQKRLTEQIAGAADARSGVTIARVRITGGTSGEAIETALAEKIRPGDLVAQLGGGEFGLLLGAVTESHAHQLVGELARALMVQGAEVLAGIAQSGDGEPEKLLEIAGERMARPSQAIRARLSSSMDSAMQSVERLIEKIAKSATHVLIIGETGVGKDVIAQTIHDRSARANGPFIRVNCVDLSDSFLEEAATNFLARARGGTVHLDEVAGLSPRAQLSLGYLLDESPSTGHDVRFLASSNQDLNAHVASGAFRKDLFFRLNQVTIVVPPLRQRPGDIIGLAEMFIARTAEATRREAPKLTEAAAELLRGYAWPGNIRELKNVIERAMLLSHGNELGVDQLPHEMSGRNAQGDPGATLPSISAEEALAPEATGDDTSPGTGKPGSLRDEIAALEKKRILEALQKYPTQRDAAAALDMPMRTFLNRLDALGIPRARGGGQKQS